MMLQRYLQFQEKNGAIYDSHRLKKQIISVMLRERAEFKELFMIKTNRIKIYPATRMEMEIQIAAEKDDELKAAYSEMLEGCMLHPDEWEWYAMWIIELDNGTRIGDLCFKGLDSSGVVEIGYGILEEYQGQGYATEAVKVVTAWAFQNSKVVAIEAETDAQNTVSQRVLEKCGFIANGKWGDEGPRFVLTR